MAAPTSNNEVTARRLTRLLTGSDGNGGLWGKIKDKISSSINALDVSSVGGAGKYISAISETDGKISATATTMDTSPTASSTNAVTSGGVKTALDGKANDSDVVHKTGTETISGVKTFSDASSVFSGKCANDANGVPLSSAFGRFRSELGNPTMEERGIIEETFANQLECLPKSNVVYETSPKGTETWTTLTVSDSTHKLLWGGNVTGGLNISKNVDFRITINAPYYCWLSFLYFYATGSGATFHIKLEKKLSSSGAWSVVSDTASASLGWPGHNTIRHVNLSFGGTYGSVRLTLYMVSTGDIETYPSYSIYKFRYYGGYPYKSDPWIVKNGSSGVTSFPKGITSGVAIPVSSGGTGKTSVTADSYLKGNGTGELVERTYAEVRSDLGISAGANKVEASTTNGKIKIDGTETTVYTHPSQTAQSAKGSATKVPQITTDSTGHVTGITEVTITGVTPASHTHGNITNGGALQTNDVTIASGDKLVITDSSDSSKVARASISFDGSTATKALTQKGTWETFNNYIHPSYTATTAAAKKIGCDATGHVVFGDALAKSDVGLGSVVNTGDSATPVSGGTTKFTTGGAYTELAKKANKADSVYYVAATFPMDAYSSSKTYAKWTSGAYTSANSCVYNNYAYYCKTAITTAEAWNSAHWTRIATTTWNGTIDGVTEITAGLKIAIKLPGYGGSSSTKLNINGLGEKDFRYNTSGYTTHYSPGLVVFAAYNGSYWGIPDYNSDSWVTSMGGYCSTAAATQEKGVTSSNTVLTAGMAMLVRFTNANTYNGKITMNVNSQGAKDIWINGAVSSSSNKTLPAGEHWCFYDGSKWSIWTNGTVQFKGVHADSYEAKYLTDANLAIPPYITTSTTGGASADFVVTYTGSHIPDSNYNWHIHSIVFRESTNYRLTQIATASSNTAITLTYKRNAWSSDGTTWTFAAWTEILTSNSTVAAGKISGTVATATTATKLGSSTLGSGTKPIYLSSGTATECSTYAGGTAVTLNNTSKAASTASFYAPTGAGTSGQILKSSGSGAPTWATANAALVGITVTSTSVSDGTTTFTNTDTKVTATAKTDNVNYKILATASASPTSGNATEAVYDTDITLNPSTNTIAANISGNATTAGTATKPVSTLINSSNNLASILGSSQGDVLTYHWTAQSPPTGADAITGTGSAPTAMLQVYKTHSGNYSTQVVYTADRGIYTRYYNGGTWTSWEKLNSDEKVKQTNTTAVSEYRVLLSPTTGSSETINGTLKSENFWARPSDGTFRATQFNVAGQCVLNYDTTTSAVYFTFS